MEWDRMIETGEKEGVWEWLKTIMVGLSRDLCWPRLITDEQQMNNTLVRDSWMKAIHYSLDSSQAFPPALPWFVSQFLHLHESFLPLLWFCPLFILCCISLYLHFPRYKTFSKSRTHTTTRVRCSLGTLSMQPWYRCPRASQTADIHSTLWACEDIPLTL